MGVIFSWYIAIHNLMCSTHRCNFKSSSKWLYYDLASLITLTNDLHLTFKQFKNKNKNAALFCLGKYFTNETMIC